MSQESSGADKRSVFFRLLGFARPYVAIILVAMAFATLYTGARNLRAYLFKPLMDEILFPHQSAAEQGALPSDFSIFSWGEAGEGGAEAPPGDVVGERTPDEAGDAAPPDEVARQEMAEQLRENFERILLIFLVILVAVPVGHFGKDYLVEYTLGRVLVDIQQELCAKLLALPLAFHHDRSRGDVLSRTLNDVTRAHRSLNLLFGEVVQAVIGVVVGFGVLLWISWQLTLASLLIIPLLVVVIAFFGSRVQKTAMKRQVKMADVTQRLLQILSGIKIIKAFRAEAAEEEHFQRENLTYFRRHMRVIRNRVSAHSISEMLNNAMGMGVLLLGVVAMVRGIWGITPGDIFAFSAVLLTTYRPMKLLTKGWTDLMEALASAERFVDLLDEDPGVVDHPEAVEVGPVRQGIRFSGVHFSYGREPVLNDVNLDVKAGETVALVGRTGAGKTTLVDLLVRFFDPDRGSIELDGVDLRRVKRDSLLARMAVVTQESFLFSGTIRENIRYGRPGASDQEVEAAAQAAHVDEFLDQLPDGWETDVGEVGSKLSGGQRQRITIARAILKNPDILIFDEATSSLDAKSERLVQAAIDRLLEGRTAVVIAHRLSTIRHADRIVILENGTVSNVGSHEDLMAQDGLYRELVALQSAAS